jgi:hypothetical protein
MNQSCHVLAVSEDCMRRSHAKELDLPVLILESTDLNESVPLERFPALSMFLQFALLAEFLFNHEA